MKVLHFLNSINFSGAETMLHIASDAFKKQGVDLHALSMGPPENPGNYTAVLKNAGYTIHHIPFRENISYFLDLYAFFRREKFDVIHIHPEKAFFWHALTAKMAGTKSIVRTVHNVFCYTGFLRFKRGLQRFIARNVMGVKYTSIGKSVSEVEQKYFFNKTYVVPNWIDTHKFVPALNADERTEARQKLGISLNSLAIISVGSSTVVKNHKAILYSLDKIVNKNGIKNVIYIHVGNGPLQNELKNYTHTLGLTDHVTFLGQREDVKEILIACDIFVMPSLYEGLGNSLLEALSCGLPAVVYNVYGLKDLVINNLNGIITEPNPDAFAEALLTLVNNPELREKLSKKAREFVLQEYDMNNSLEKLMNLY